MKGNDNLWSEIKKALHEIKWKAMTMHEVKLRSYKMKANNNAWNGINKKKGEGSDIMREVKFKGWNCMRQKQWQSMKWN